MKSAMARRQYAYRKRILASRGFVLAGLTGGRGLELELAARMCKLTPKVAARLVSGLSAADRQEAAEVWGCIV